MLRPAVKIPRSDQPTIDLFKSLVPDGPNVTVRPMFGNLSAFVNGNMFFGLFGNNIFVRLSSADQAQLLKAKGASNLEPMKGKPMKDYVVLPSSWKSEPETVRAWVSKSLAWSSILPSKKTKR